MQVILNVILPLLIGGFFYIVFRSTSLNMFVWFDNIGLYNTIIDIRNTFFPMKNYLPQWVYFSLPDGLWIYSFTSALMLLWDKEFNSSKYWLVIPFFSGVIIEILQGLKVFKGTFDLLDLSISLFGFLLSIYILNNKIKHNEKAVY